MVDVAIGIENTCVVFDDGRVRCWGSGEDGALGNMTVETIGDDEPASEGQDVLLTAFAAEVGVGFHRACALSMDGEIWCWGAGADGALGNGSTEDIGDDEPPSAAGPLSLPRSADLCVGRAHACAVDEEGVVRCWGAGDDGRLGQGDVESWGDDESLAGLPGIETGGPVQSIACGVRHSCALRNDSQVVCWGTNEYGQIGHGGAVDPPTLGDDETPASVPPVMLSESTQLISAGDNHTCAILDSGDVECWGRGSAVFWDGAADVGDDEVPAGAGLVDTGVVAVGLGLGELHSCLVSDTGGVRCWGNTTCAMGYGVAYVVGIDPPTPAALGDVDVGAGVTQIAAASEATCAVLTSGDVSCWGAGFYARLGYGYAPYGLCLGNEVPADIGPVPL